MIHDAISHDLGATLVGGGPVFVGDFDESRSIAPLLVAADSGADRILDLGHMPDWAIGDLDSISQSARDRIGARVIHDPCQETTDFEKCLARIDAPLILGLGFLGGQIDHELAALSVLVRQDRAIVLIGEHDIVAHVPQIIDLALAPGTRVSLFPMAAVTGRSTGLTWPIDGLKFAPGRRSGTSNRASGAVQLAFDGPGMLLILPRAALSALLTGLR
ncbi:thiamine diphosphokinase [Oceaniglobus ichthyenteri]|uniref:thiamine diphosphokinase n=1 Tax=Oceaniglobus ichthyenteri TaxID=2136177 RepID=UPI000D34290A|nr:thiamine diphosphokinase [Oceaniglobus ichthyenteri]